MISLVERVRFLAASTFVVGHGEVEHDPDPFCGREKVQRLRLGLDPFKGAPALGGANRETTHRH